MSAKEDVDSLKAVDAVRGRHDVVLGDEGSAAEVGVVPVLHEQAGHPGVFVRGRLLPAGDAGVVGAGGAAVIWKIDESQRGQSQFLAEAKALNHSNR